MPELPEVETIARGLQVVMPGARCTGVLVGLPKMIKVPLVKFRRNLINYRIRRVHRRAKLLLIDVASGSTVIIHLKMSGQLIWQPRRGARFVGGHPIPGGVDVLPNRFTHVTITTNRGVLYFNDQRQFGFLKLIRTDALEAWLEAQGYGPEPLADDFTFGVFEKILFRHQAKRIKPTLLDQRVVAGIGNIYADEACHFAQINPARRIKTLRLIERQRLFRGIRHVMRLSLRHNGTTAEHYRTANGRKGTMNRFLRVYGRTGQPCRRCGHPIVKIILAQRGTHFCRYCQR